MYVKGVSLITRDRLVLLDLFFRRCEVRLRGRLAERVRQQVHEEAAADLAVHRQLMRPSSGAAGTAVALAADVFSVASATTAGARSGRTKRIGGSSKGSGGGDEDAVGELMETVAALRLKSALEELETRSARPDVKRRLLEGLLVKVTLLLPAGEVDHFSAKIPRLSSTWQPARGIVFRGKKRPTRRNKRPYRGLLSRFVSCFSPVSWHSALVRFTTSLSISGNRRR